jgi:hypothetical protein
MVRIAVLFGISMAIGLVLLFCWPDASLRDLGDLLKSTYTAK